MGMSVIRKMIEYDMLFSVFIYFVRLYNPVRKQRYDNFFLDSPAKNAELSFFWGKDGHSGRFNIQENARITKITKNVVSVLFFVFIFSIPQIPQILFQNFLSVNVAPVLVIYFVFFVLFVSFVDKEGGFFLV
jgi:hypothetical protein